MADYPLSLTASEIDVALQKSHNPDTDLTETANNDPSLVTAGAVKNYVDTKVSQGASITVDSFAGSSLETSSEGISATDDAIPTSGLVNKLYGFSTNVDGLSQAGNQAKCWSNTSLGLSPQTISLTNLNNNNITGSGNSLTITKGLYAVNLATTIQLGRYTTGYVQLSFGSYYDPTVSAPSNTLDGGVLRISKSNSSNSGTDSSLRMTKSGLIHIPSSRSVVLRYYQGGASNQSRCVYIYNTAVQFFKLI